MNLINFNDKKYIMFYTYDDVIRLTKIFGDLPTDVSEELRGWNWNQYPLLPASRTKVSVSEVLGGFCDSEICIC